MRSLVPPLALLLFLQVPPVTISPIRTGEIARQLADADVAALEMALPPGAKPWLLDGEPVLVANVQSIDAYLLPTTVTTSLRRGPIVNLSRHSAPPAAWTAKTSGSYAQVKIGGRSFDQIQGDGDVNRPFRVTDGFDDGDLVQLVEFLRSSPAVGRRFDPIRRLPIVSVTLRADGSVEVQFREASMQGQWIQLNRSGRTWHIVSAGVWMQ